MGSPKALRPMLLNGFQHPVTVNLDAALRRLRQADYSGNFWIDAICINQFDNNERNHQVNLMRDIYTSAEEVLVYLGELSRNPIGYPRASATPTSSTTFNFDNSDKEQLELFQERCTSGTNTGAPMLKTSIDYAVEVFRFVRCMAQGKNLGDIPPFNDSSQCQIYTKYMKTLFESLRLLTVSRWWTRIWVIQEVVVPTNITVIYDSAQAPWTMFVEAAECYTCTHGQSVRLLRTFPTDYIKVVERFSRLILDIEVMRQTWSGGVHMSLLSLLRQFGDRNASDDRDKVFALLGLAREEKTMQPDYSIDVPEVYKRTALNTIATTFSLNMMNGDMGRKFRQDLPSWVPDWSAVRDEREQRRAENATIYHASEDSIVYYPDDVDDEWCKYIWYLRKQSHSTDGIEHALLQGLEVLERERLQIAQKKEELKRHLEQQKLLLEKERIDLPKKDLDSHAEVLLVIVENIARQLLQISRKSQAWTGKWKEIKHQFSWKVGVEPDLYAPQRFMPSILRKIEEIQEKENEIQALEDLLQESMIKEELEVWMRACRGQFGPETKPETIQYLKTRLDQCDFLDMVRLVLLAEGQFATLHNTHDGVLKAPGQHIDTVRSVGAICHSESHLDILPVVRNWIRLISSWSGLRMSRKIFWETLCGDMVREENTAGGTPFRRINDDTYMQSEHASLPIHEYEKDVVGGVDPREEQHAEDILFHVLASPVITMASEMAQRMGSAIRTAMYRRSLFITEKGHIGLGPASTAPGDHLFVLMGARTPFILRGVLTNAQEAYTDDELEVIGDCYAHGFMDGEGMKEWRKKVYERLASPRWSQIIENIKADLSSTETQIRDLGKWIDHESNTPQDRESILQNIQSQEGIARTLRRKIEAYSGYVHLV